MRKTYIVYGLSPSRIARLRALLLGADWTPTRFPGWSPSEASHPFVAFDQVPARSPCPGDDSMAELFRRVPAGDTATVVRGPFGNSPNFFFEVDAGEVGSFVDALRAVSSAAAFTAFVERFGVRRTDPRFWATSDWLRQDLRRREPTGAGLYDLDRFGNF